jgi:hypothetical protein
VEQIRTFAEPILAAIADRSPDYEDDFSDPGSGWPIGSTADGDEWGYENDACFISATYLPQGKCCIGVGSDTVPLFSDFVLELDAQFVSGEWGHWGVIFRDLGGIAESPDHYAVGFWPDGHFRVWKDIDLNHIALLETAESPVAFEQGYEMNHLTIIAQGPQIAFYVNREPLWFIYDESVSRGRITLNVENLQSTSPLRVHFDNLRVWEISELSKPSAEAMPTPRPALREATHVHTLLGHTSLVESVAWSPDGTILASGGGVDDNTVILWDTRTGERLRTLEGHIGEVDVVEWSPDGTILASGSSDSSVILWDIETGETRRTLVGHTSVVDDLAFSPDGKMLATGDVGGLVIMWNIETGERLRTLVGHTDEVQGVGCPDRRAIAYPGRTYRLGA